MIIIIIHPRLPRLTKSCDYLGDWGTGIEQLDRSMKARHLNMIAMGGSIGSGFFVGSGTAFTAGGPGSVFICFCIAGVLVFNVVHALGELAVMYPISGGMYTYSVRFISPSWGTAMGWNYVSFLLPFLGKKKKIMKN
jgi:amino acid transporter